MIAFYAYFKDEIDLRDRPFYRDRQLECRKVPRRMSYLFAYHRWEPLRGDYCGGQCFHRRLAGDGSYTISRGKTHRKWRKPWLCRGKQHRFEESKREIHLP